jgi:hypothetical protein
LNETFDKIISTIYIGKGTHFFFSCSGQEDSKFI